MKNTKNIKISIPLFVVGIFFLLPVVYILLASLFGSPHMTNWNSLDFKHFNSAFLDTNLTNSLINSFLTAIISSTIGILMTLTYLNVIKIKGEKQRKWHIQVLSIPIFLPDVLWGLSLLFIIKLLNITTGFIPVLIVHIIFNSFLSYIFLRQPIIGYSNSQINSAKIFGLSSYDIALNIIIPNLKTQIFGCFLLCFIYSFDDFLLTYLLSGSTFQTFPLYMYSKLKFGLSQSIISVTAIYALFNILLFTLLYKLSFKFIAYEK